MMKSYIEQPREESNLDLTLIRRDGATEFAENCGVALHGVVANQGRLCRKVIV
jgi:hypothetical protein